MKTDKLAYLWLQEMPEGFFALIGRNPNDAQRYDFKSIELKELSARLDAVLIPKQPDLTYFVEFQFQRDNDFYARFFAQTLLYLKQHRVTKWRAVVVYPSRSVEQESCEGYEELLAETRTRRIYLDELGSAAELDAALGAFKLVVEPEARAIEVARRLIERSPEKLDFIERVLFYKFRNLTRKEILKMLGVREEFEEELKKTRAYQEILEEG
ncbi:MAG: Rpn family recombination-promoting nuclease/putative transposase, partial [Chloroherpetonaceae bacterium]|nr:Rpn family recombination-promoting nuclease/putative transposase [Chloroherpetonaceae bacterium]MDW8438741.1 Rpn family recombination-promoting nuclease/putative transposase [Chloroherpetonaceae bacterium]